MKIMNTPKLTEIYDRITNAIIELLENHELQYSCEWLHVKSDLHHNPETKHTYSGINQLYLSIISYKLGYDIPRWLTIFQVNALNGKVKKGSKAVPVVYVNTMYFLDEKKISFEIYKNLNTEQLKRVRKVPYLKEYKVFNVADCEALPEEFYQILQPTFFTEFGKDETAEHILLNSGASIEYRVQNHAFYNPMSDVITLPDRRQFEGKEPFYCTAFHELGHWTGHPDRMNRLKTTKSERTEYAYEELVAELFAAFMCANCGFGKTITNNAAYIKSWLKALKNDNRFIVEAASQAQRACDYVLNLKQESIAA
jgi:antirestriction protein ArdC